MNKNNLKIESNSRSDVSTNPSVLTDVKIYEVRGVAASTLSSPIAKNENFIVFLFTFDNIVSDSSSLIPLNLKVQITIMIPHTHHNNEK
jgi:hypothetical protein